MENLEMNNEYMIIKALSSTVQIIGLTRGDSTVSHHTENLSKGELLVTQFTEKTSAIKIKGKVELYTKYGKVTGGDIE